MVQIRRIFCTVLLIAVALGTIGVVPSYADMIADSQEAQFAPICHCEDGCTKSDMCTSAGMCAAACASQMMAVVAATRPDLLGGHSIASGAATKIATPIDRPPPLLPPNIRI